MLLNWLMVILKCYIISGYDEALAQYSLKKFLLLVLFLDHAKLTRLIDHDPCLFCKDADFKVSSLQNPKFLSFETGLPVSMPLVREVWI